MADQLVSPEYLLAELASRQHGVVSARQLAQLGIEKRAAHRRRQAGRLHRVHRGVYAVGYPGLSKEGRWMAAVLASSGSVLSHRSAAALWELLPPENGFAHVTLPGLGGRPNRPGIRIHRSRTLTAASTTRRRGIPVTTAARTINDLRGTIPAGLLRRAVRQTGVLGLEIEGEVEVDRTRSELEQSFLRLCRRHRLPKPTVNTKVGHFTVDFFWPERRLIVETDGYRYHRGRQAFEDDRARDVELHIAGFEVIRFTHRQITGEPARVAAVLRTLLA